MQSTPHVGREIASAAITLVLAGSLFGRLHRWRPRGQCARGSPGARPGDVSITERRHDTVLPNGVVTVSARTGTLNHVDVTDPSGV